MSNSNNNQIEKGGDDRSDRDGGGNAALGGHGS